jgi:hypothetical protein
LFEFHQFLNHRDLTILLDWIWYIKPSKTGARAVDMNSGVSGRDRGSLYCGAENLSALIDQGHLELLALKSTSTYLSWEGGFGKAIVGHRQTKLIRQQLILDF